MTFALAQRITEVFRVLAHTRVAAREFEFWTAMTSPASSPEPRRPVDAFGGLDTRDSDGPRKEYAR